MLAYTRSGAGSRSVARRRDLARLPDVRDGLSRLERVILWQLDVLRKELGRERIPSAMLYGRVAEHVDVSSAELEATLARLVRV